MISQPVFAAIRRSNLNGLALSALGVVLVVVVGLFNIRYLSNFVSGPSDIEQTKLLNLDNPETLANYWVNVTGDDVADTGMQLVSTSSRSNRETVEANYMALFINDRLLLVKTPSSDMVTDYTGALVPFPDDVRTEVVQYIEAEEDIEGAFLPYMLETDDFRFNGYVGFVFGGLVLAASAYGFGTGVLRSNPSKHPIMRRLTRHGDTAAVVSEVENELIAPRWSHRNLHVTQNWLVQSGSADFHAVRLNEIVWMYKHVTQRRVNGIPAGKMFAAHVYDSHGEKVVLAGKNEQDVDAMLSGVYAIVPWIITGYNQEIEKTWKLNRSALAETVGHRRQQQLLSEA